MRKWNNQSSDDVSIHAMGNGELLAYGFGPDIAHLYGPPYSSPNILQLYTKCDQPLTDQAEREAQTAIWRHALIMGGEDALDFTEFVASDAPVYVRQFSCRKSGVSFILHPHLAGGFFANAAFPGVWQQVLLPGQRVMQYPLTFPSYHWLLLDGACVVTSGEDGTLIVACTPGEGYIAIIGANDYALGAALAERVKCSGVAPLLAETRKYWAAFTQRRLAACPAASAAATEEILVAMDSVAVLIKTQQATDGGVMAGHNYPLAYVRDQYGMARGLLSLGLFEEARRNLRFRYDKFTTFGNLNTAESMGTDCARHVHENDEVEGPAYTILQVRDYLTASGDEQFARAMWPMLAWCWQAQLKHLVNGLLPFNGDETYVAGGYFPRSGLLQGSADSTLVFIEAGKWLAKWAVQQGFWTHACAESQRAQVEAARIAYRRSFVADGKVWANAPERRGQAPEPRFRTGVCEACRGWRYTTERNVHGRYLCPQCMPGNDTLPASPPRMEVNSVSLLPVYIGSDILSQDEQRAVIDHVLAQANAVGHIPSVPGSEGCVGYDPGLILLTLLAVQHPATEHACQRLLRLLDSSGAWCEYYGANERSGWCCRARPWESGVNIAALVAYLMAGRRSG